MYNPVLSSGGYTRMSRSLLVGKPSTFSKAMDKAFFDGNIHTKLRSNLLLPLTLH